jgi:hypothetical protein
VAQILRQSCATHEGSILKWRSHSETSVTLPGRLSTLTRIPSRSFRWMGCLHFVTSMTPFFCHIDRMSLAFSSLHPKLSMSSVPAHQPLSFLNP